MATESTILPIIEASDCKGSGPETVNILLGNADGTYQPGQAVYSSNNQIVQPYVLRLNRDSKPDLSVAEAASPYSDIFFTNTTPGKFPACAPPDRGIGITLCSPSSTVVPGSPVHFSIGAASQTPGRKVEVWIDGKKMSENLKQSFSHYSFLDASYNVRQESTVWVSMPPAGTICCSSILSRSLSARPPVRLPLRPGSMYAVRLKTRRWENPRRLGPAARLQGKFCAWRFG